MTRWACPVSCWPAALLAASLLLLASSDAVQAATYTSGSTSYSFIDSSTHAKVGHNTAPYKFNGGGGCGSTPPTLDDTLSGLIPIGFTFAYGTVSYTSVYVMTNGRLQFGNTTCGYGTAGIGPPQTYPFVYPDASMNGTMKVFGVDLDPTNLVDLPNYPTASNKTPCASSNSCYVSAATIGTAPARQFVVTWKNVPEWVTASNTSGSFDLQVILNEDGTFVYQYGNINHGGTGTAQIGWQLSNTDYEVLSFGAALEPPPFTAIKFYLPAPLATYSFDEAAWASGLAGQVKDSSAAARSGTALGSAQTTSAGKVCRAANIPLNTSAASVDAVQTGIDLSNAALNLLGTGTIAFWYRSNTAWSGSGAQAAQLLDATAVNGEWFFLSKTAAGALVFEVKDSTGSVRAVTTAAQGFAANTWVHIAVAWNFNGSAGSNQDSLQIFINAGAPTTSAFTSSGTVTALVGTLHVGDNAIGVADTLGSVNSANGLVDEVEIYNYALTQAQVNTVQNDAHPCGSFTIDHLEIQHASGSGVTCTPGTLTLRACANASCSSAYTGGLSGTLSATGTPTVNWDGSTGYASGAGFVIPAGSSSVSKSFQATTVGTVLVGTSGLSPAVSAATTCNFGTPGCTWTAADSGFMFSVPNHAAETLQTVSVSAVRTSSNSLVCIPAFASVSKTVNFSCSYANPTSGTLPVRVAGGALNATASTAAACDSGGRGVSLAFDATGAATTTVQYADVGNVTLSARYSGGTGVEAGLLMTGSTSFVVRPSAFTTTGIKCTSTASGNCAAALPAPGNNPGAMSAGGAAFIPAGRSFTATVTAVNAAGAATPNYGRETSPEGVLLTRALVLPAGGASGTLSNATIAGGSFSAGVATVTNLSFSEVGIITLSPSVADGDYLGGGNVTGTTTGNIGRFVPAQFALSAGSVTQRSALSCAPASGFSYLGENFRLGFTLTAQNSAGATTSNYTGSFAKLDPATVTWNLAGRDATTVFTLASTRLALGSATGSFSNGVASGISLTANATRASLPDGPFNAAFGVAPVDSDGVALGSFNMASTSGGGNDRASVANVVLRFGRLRLANATGAADRALSLPAVAQYWDGASFATNTLDNCTTVAASAVNFGKLRGTLTTADTAVNGAIALSAGLGTLRLAAPAGGRSGTADLALSLGSSATDASCLQPWTPGSGDAASAGANLAFLRGAWCSASYGQDPSARATFGRQRDAGNTVYRRENY